MQTLVQNNGKLTAGISFSIRWLYPDPVLMKSNVRSSKCERLQDEAQFYECNPHQIQVRIHGGRDYTFSL